MKINVHFLIFLAISLIALLNDYIIYITKLPYVVSLIISTIVITLCNIILIKKKKITVKSDWNKFDLIFILITLVFLFLLISSPDYSYDVSNYHVYLQSNFPVDKINFDFHAGKVLNGFLFPLGDRMHYIFRYIFGYRFGTILSYYSLVVIFYQCKKIMLLFTDKKKWVSFLSVFCVFSSQILMQWIGTYYIDIFSVIYMLQMVYIIMNFYISKEYKRETILLLGLISGICTAIKVTNMLLLAPMLLISLFILKPKKDDIKYIVISVLIIFSCFALYLYDNQAQTGSILFPYFNSILKSSYFENYSYVEPRFGIPNFLYALIWPIYVSTIGLGYGDDWVVFEPNWAIGYVFLLITLLVQIIKKKMKNLLFFLCSFTLLLTFLWIMLLYGYMRYALVIPILYVIIICVIFLKNISIFTEKYLGYFILEISIVLLIQISLNIYVFHQAYNSNNYKLLFNDHDTKKIHIDGVWGTINDNSVLNVLAREKDTPIYNLDITYIKENKKSKNMYDKKIKDTDIYMIVSDKRLERDKKALEKNGFELGELVKTYTHKELKYLSVDTKAYLYKINKK